MLKQPHIYTTNHQRNLNFRLEIILLIKQVFFCYCKEELQLFVCFFIFIFLACVFNLLLALTMQQDHTRPISLHTHPGDGVPEWMNL